MNTLPLEIITKIASYFVRLKEEDVIIQEVQNFTLLQNVPQSASAQYATISRPWQFVIEEITFRHLVLTPKRIQDALRYHILTPRRLSHIRYMEVAFKFTPGSMNMEASRETASRAIQSLFALLEATPFTERPELTLKLEIPVHMFHQNPWAPYDHPRQRDKDRICTGNASILYLKLGESILQELPELPMVESFVATLAAHSIAFEPRMMCLLASKMPRLETVSWELTDAEKLDPGLRIRQRTGLADGLANIPTSVKRFALSHFRTRPRDESFQPASIVPENEIDPLSKAVFCFSQRSNLVYFGFGGTLDATAMWSPLIEEKPHWPIMEGFYLTLDPVFPSGQWICVPDPEDHFIRVEQSSIGPLRDGVPGEQRLHRVRSHTDSQLFDDISLAAGKCAAQMPRIKDFEIWFRSLAYPGIIYRTTADKDIPPLELIANPLSEPSEETIKIWREVTDSHHMNFWMSLEGCLDDEMIRKYIK